MLLRHYVAGLLFPLLAQAPGSHYVQQTRSPDQPPRRAGHSTPYFLNAWTSGQIDLLNGSRYADVPLKFDAFRQELVVRRPQLNNDSIILDRATVSGFRLAGPAGQSYRFRRYPHVAATGGGYFLVLYEGQTALLKRVVKTRPGQDAVSSNLDLFYEQVDFRRPANQPFVERTDYYVLKANGTLTRVKLTKRALLDALADKQHKLKPFADELVLRTEADAVTLVREYDRP